LVFGFVLFFFTKPKQFTHTSLQIIKEKTGFNVPIPKAPLPPVPELPALPALPALDSIDIVALANKAFASITASGKSVAAPTSNTSKSTATATAVVAAPVAENEDFGQSTPEDLATYTNKSSRP
jgi:hypothetical protein